MYTLLHLATLAVTVLAIARFLPDVEVKGFGTAVVVSVVFSVLNFFLGAVLTTPEVFTQLIMAIPLTLMYESVIWIAWFMEWKKKRRSEG